MCRYDTLIKVTFQAIHISLNVIAKVTTKVRIKLWQGVLYAT